MKKCDNKCSGQIIRNERGEILLIERHNYPQAIALPAGHLDGDDFPTCAEKEALEETGLTVAENAETWQGPIDNPCKREGGTRHEWAVFDTSRWSGELKPASDAKRTFWANDYTLKRLALRTKYFLAKYNLKEDQVGELTLKIFGDPKSPNTDPEWVEEPGIEPVWYFILRKLQIV